LNYTYVVSARWIEKNYCLQRCYLKVDVVDKGPTDWSERGGSGEWGVGPPAAPPGGSPDKGSLELGELEQLTINNDNDLNYDQITAPKVGFNYRQLDLYIKFEHI
jgi:hypothetical protein